MFPQIFGKYVLEHEIASGGMARVYLATLRGAVGFEKRLVVKQIRPELASDEAFVRRFVEEAKTTVELSHPNIVPVYELGVEQGTYYIAMEFCEGVTLAELLAETGPLSPEEGAYVGVEICRALDYAHRRASIVHRDVTPRNVIIDDEGGVRLIDFGIAAPGPADGMVLVSRAEVFGSPGHMPPEQLQGKRLTPATDVFAVGALLIEAWTGRPPFRRATLVECERALLTPPPRLDRDDSRFSELADLMASAVALESEARPESAELLARPMRQFLKSADLGEVERRLGERVRKARRHLHTSSPWLPGEGLADLNTRSNAPAGPATPSNRSSAEAHSPAETPPAGAPMPVGTLTFAVREDLALWTRRIPSEPPPGSETPNQGEVRRKRAVKTVRIEQAPEALGLERAPLESAAEPAAQLSRRHEEDTPLTATGTGADSARAASSWRLVAAVLAGVVIAGLLSVRVFRTSSQQKSVSEDSALSPAGPRAAHGDVPLAFASATTARSAPADAAAHQALAPKLALPLASPAGGSGPSGSSSATLGAPDQQRLGTLILNSEPSARVSVAGRSGTTPLTLKLKSGRYTVVFLEATLRETLSRSIELGAGETKTIVADFTAATPHLVP